jgi:hypothetical protein
MASASGLSSDRSSNRDTWLPPQSNMSRPFMLVVGTTSTQSSPVVGRIQSPQYTEVYNHLSEMATVTVEGFTTLHVPKTE